MGWILPPFVCLAGLGIWSSQSCMLARSCSWHSNISADQAPARADFGAIFTLLPSSPSQSCRDSPPCEGIARIRWQPASIGFCGVQLKCEACPPPKYSMTPPALVLSISSPNNWLCNFCSELPSAGCQILGQDLMNSYTEMPTDMFVILPRPILQNEEMIDR